MVYNVTLTSVKVDLYLPSKGKNMRNQQIHRIFGVIPMLFLVLMIAGCAGSPTKPVAAPSSAIVETAVPASSEEPVIDQTTPSTPTLEPVIDKNVLYQEEFTNLSSGWAEEAFDNYFIGYHGPEFYHVQVLSPNYKTLVSTPDKAKYGDVTVDLEVFTESAAEGDFRYGLVFRRSGDQYYAFTISPSTKTWYLLKSSTNALEVLKEGTNKSIQGLEASDVLRVDAKGSTFFLHINDQLVDQVNDPDYVDGEVGLFVQSFESLGAHIHFDTLTIWDFKAPAICSVITKAMNVRNGPGESFVSLTTLLRGDSVEPLGRSIDGGWMLVRLDESNQQGWIANSANWLSCIMSFADLPIIEP